MPWLQHEAKCVVGRASEWFSLKYGLQTDSVCLASDQTEAVFLSSVTHLHCYAYLSSACLAHVFVLMWTRLYTISPLYWSSFQYTTAEPVPIGRFFKIFYMAPPHWSIFQIYEGGVQKLLPKTDNKATKYVRDLKFFQNIFEYIGWFKNHWQFFFINNLSSNKWKNVIQKFVKSKFYKYLFKI